MGLSKVGCTEDNALGNTTERDTTKVQGSISSHALMITQFLIIVMGFQDKFRDKDCILGTSIIYVTMFLLIVLFVSLSSFILPLELVL